MYFFQSFFKFFCHVYLERKKLVNQISRMKIDWNIPTLLEVIQIGRYKFWKYMNAKLYGSAAVDNVKDHDWLSLVTLWEPLAISLKKRVSCLRKNYATYYRSTRVQVWTISKYFELYWTIFSVYLALSQFISVYFGLSCSISLHLGLSRTISDYLGLSRTISDYLRLSRTISDYLWLSLIISDYLGLSLTILDYLWLSWTNSDYFGLFWTILDYFGLSLTIFDYLWLSMTIFDYIGLSGNIWDYLGLSRTIWDYMGLYFFTRAIPRGAHAPKKHWEVDFFFLNDKFH